MIPYWFILVTLLLCKTGALSEQLWRGTSKVSSSTESFIGGDYVSIGIDVVVTLTSAVDNVLLLVNLNNKPREDNQYAQYTIFRNAAAICSGFMATVHSLSKEERQAVTFSFLDEPNETGSYTYSVRMKGTGIVSDSNQFRQIGAMVIPSTVPTGTNTVPSVLEIKTTEYVDLGVAVKVTTSLTTDLVLVCASFSINPLVDNAVAKISLFRDYDQVDTFAMQLVSMSRTGNNRMGSFFFVDSPANRGSISYSLRAAQSVSSPGGVSVSEGNTDMTQLSLVVVPAANAAFVTSEIARRITSTSWIICGLSATITPLDATDTVLITVNINFYPATTASVGMFTIFRDAQNLGHDSSGLQRVNTGEAAIATMSFLDSPNTSSPVTYTVKVRCHETAKPFTVSYNGQTRQIAVIASRALGRGILT